MELRKIYEYALAREREGRDFFERNAQRVSHSAAAGVFRMLAEEEKQHIDYIEWLMESLDVPQDGSPPEPSPDDKFTQRAKDELLNQSITESMVPDLAVLRTAYLIERDFVEFYSMAANKFTGEAHKAFVNLANWEKSHEELFRRLHDKAFEEYAGMPWGG